MKSEGQRVVCKYRIFNADAFEWLRKRRTRSVHAVVTDPTYAIVEYSEEQLNKIRNGNGGIWRLPQQYDGFVRRQVPRFTVLTKRELQGISLFRRSLAPLLRRVLVPGGHVFLASQNLLSYLGGDPVPELRARIPRYPRDMHALLGAMPEDDRRSQHIRLVRTHGERCAVRERVTPHMFRHSVATYLLEEGVDIRYVQRLLGHRSISTTEIYTQVADAALKVRITEKHPRRTIVGA